MKFDRYSAEKVTILFHARFLEVCSGGILGKANAF